MANLRIHTCTICTFRIDEMKEMNPYIGEQICHYKCINYCRAVVISFEFLGQTRCTIQENILCYCLHSLVMWCFLEITAFNIASMHSYMCAQAQGSQVTHGPYTDVPKLLISSNSVRLLNVVGQGTLICLCCPPNTLDMYYWHDHVIMSIPDCQLTSTYCCK